MMQSVQATKDTLYVEKNGVDLTLKGRVYDWFLDRFEPLLDDPDRLSFIVLVFQGMGDFPTDAHADVVRDVMQAEMSEVLEAWEMATADYNTEVAA